MELVAFVLVTTDVTLDFEKPDLHERVHIFETSTFILQNCVKIILATKKHSWFVPESND